MIKQYKDLKHTIEQSGWGIGLDGLDGISHEDCKLQTGSCKTAKEIILKRCAWYYEYKQLFCNHPGVNPPALIKSEQPIRCNDQIVNDSELGRYDKGLQEGELGPEGLNDFDQDAEKDGDDSDSSSLHLANCAK